MRIKCLAMTLEREEATNLLKSRMQQFRRGRFLFATGFYVPYYLFRVEVQKGERRTEQLLAIDATTGELDLYGFEQLPTEMAEAETMQMGALALTESQARAVMEEKVRRSVYQQGFFKLRNLQITSQYETRFYLPYWVGLYERKSQIEVEVIDAVRGRFEGAKVRDVVLEWFRQEAARRTPQPVLQS